MFRQVLVTLARIWKDFEWWCRCQCASQTKTFFRSQAHSRAHSDSNPYNTEIWHYLLLYLWLLFRIVIVAQNSDTVFGKLLTIGVGIPIVFQALVNMGVAVELFPVTGQTLPLISSGGTSIWVTCLALGIVLSVSVKPDVENTQETEGQHPLEILSEAL